MRPVNRACLSRRALSTGHAASRNAHPRLHAGAHTEPRTDQLSIRVQATHGQHTGPGPFQCRRRFPGCGRHRPQRRRTTRGPLRRRVPVVLRGGCSKHPLSHDAAKVAGAADKRASCIAGHKRVRSSSSSDSERAAGGSSSDAERAACSVVPRAGVCRSICCAVRLCHSVRPKQAHRAAWGFAGACLAAAVLELS